MVSRNLLVLLVAASGEAHCRVASALACSGLGDLRVAARNSNATDACNEKLKLARGNLNDGFSRRRQNVADPLCRLSL